MTNQEYEEACLTAAMAYDRFEGEHKLKQIDEHIAQVEKILASLQEMRREIVNQYNLNKSGLVFTHPRFIRAARQEIMISTKQVTVVIAQRQWRRY